MTLLAKLSATTVTKATTVGVLILLKEKRTRKNMRRTKGEKWISFYLLFYSLFYKNKNKYDMD